MTDQKLIDDVVTAFADRDITAPSRDDIARVLEVFETSLRRCGCDDCTTARREHIGLTEHDLTSLARVLHEVVYSPGASFDQTVPGIQEYMHACAEKVAAALPWVVPTPEVELVVGEAHTPTDDEIAAERDRRHPELTGTFGDHLNSVRLDREQAFEHDGKRDGFLEGAKWAAALRRSEVPEPSLIEIAHRIGATERSRHDFDLATSRPLGSEPQGEPSDAQRYRSAIEDALPMIGLMRPWNTSPEQIENVRLILSRALRAAGGVR